MRRQRCDNRFGSMAEIHSSLTPVLQDDVFFALLGADEPPNSNPSTQLLSKHSVRCTTEGHLSVWICIRLQGDPFILPRPCLRAKGPRRR